MDSVLGRRAAVLFERARSKLQLDCVASAMRRSESKSAMVDAKSKHSPAVPTSSAAAIGAIQPGDSEEASAAAGAIPHLLAVVKSSVSGRLTAYQAVVVSRTKQPHEH
eukprot:5576177-Prymnesium_polylepis.1